MQLPASLGKTFITHPLWEDKLNGTEIISWSHWSVYYAKGKCDIHYKYQEKVNKLFEQLVTNVWVLMKDCNNANSEEMIRGWLVFGIRSSRVRKKLQNFSSDLMLENKIAQTQLKTIARSNSGACKLTVYAISSFQRKMCLKMCKDKTRNLI